MKHIDPASQPTEERQLLAIALGALRSYQCGNSASDLAKEIADDIEAFLEAPAIAFLQEDALDVQNWVYGAMNPRSGAGDFVRRIAEACARADWENYPILRPALLAIAKKYPSYTPLGAGMRVGAARK